MEKQGHAGIEGWSGGFCGTGQDASMTRMIAIPRLRCCFVTAIAKKRNGSIEKEDCKRTIEYSLKLFHDSKRR